MGQIKEDSNHTLFIEAGDEKKFDVIKCIPDSGYLIDGEKLLGRVFGRIKSKKDNPKDIEKIDVQEAVYLLDAIYHTRLEHHIQIADQIYIDMERGQLLNSILCVRKNDATSDVASMCVDKIACAGKRVGEGYDYAYSFATKFCSWLNPDGFIIFDGIAAGLLQYYINQGLKLGLKKTNIECINMDFLKGKKDRSLNVTKLGDYKMYAEAYELFIKMYDLNEYSYKDIDKFIWTYGTALLSFFNPGQEQCKEKTVEANKCPFKRQNPSYIPLSKMDNGS